MRGIGHVAVVLHRKCPITKQMQQDRLACRVKNADIKRECYAARVVNDMLLTEVNIRLILKKKYSGVGIIYE